MEGERESDERDDEVYVGFRHLSADGLYVDFGG